MLVSRSPRLLLRKSRGASPTLAYFCASVNYTLERDLVVLLLTMGYYGRTYIVRG